jgi:hypothetical protein
MKVYVLVYHDYEGTMFGDHVWSVKQLGEDWLSERAAKYGEDEGWALEECELDDPNAELE